MPNGLRQSISASLVGIALSCAAPVTMSADTLDAHVHGKVQLDLAIDGGQLAIWLASPAVNMMGFERPPETAEEEQAIEQAIADLGNIDRVLALPASLECNVVGNEATLVMGEDGHDHGHDDHNHDEHDHDKEGYDEHKYDDHGHDEHDHNEHDHGEEDHKEHGHDEHGHDEHAHEGEGHKEHGHDEHDHADKEHEHEHEHEEHAGEHDHAGGAQHAEFRAEYTLECGNFDVETLDVRLFETFPGIEEIDVRGVLPQGQIGQTLEPGDATIRLGSG